MTVYPDCGALLLLLDVRKIAGSGALASGYGLAAFLTVVQG